MILDAFTSRPNTRVYPEATDRHVRRILGTEEDERILAEAIELTESDHGGPHVIKPYGNLVTPRDLLDIRTSVIDQLASEGLQLGQVMTVLDRTKWDRTLGAALLDHLHMEPFQVYSSSDGDDIGNAWTYLTVHVFPEFPGWRFPGRTFASSTQTVMDDDDRDVVKAIDRVRGGRRNVLFRVWFRAFILGSDYRLPDGAENLSEDELDNIFGRPTITRNHELTRKIVDCIYRNRPRSANRNFVVRELMKEIRRRYALVHFSALGDKLDEELDRLWERAEARYDANVKRTKASPHGKT